MNSNICNICGAEYEYINGRWKCPYCGSHKHDGTSDDEHILICNAFQTLRSFEFVKAEDMFLDIIRKYPEQHEAYWGYVCAHYGIKVETDELTEKKIPTCCFPTIESFANDKYFKKAVEYAPAEVRAWYVAQGEYIEYIRKRWLEIDKEEPKYDIFISFKDKDGDKNIPYDRNNVMMLYNYLKNYLNYNVFCSCMSLADKYGKEFEPYIFHALKTAKVMIVYSSSADYVSMPWVKNEWQRYLHMINSEEKREDSLVAVCNGFSPSRLPSALSKRQCFDATEPTYFPNISDYLERIVGKDNGENGKRKSSKKARVSDSHKHEYKVKVVDATCVAKGYTLYECSCGDSYRDNYTDLVDHKYKFSKKVDPGCDTAGYTERKCTVCGERLRDPIQPLGHSFSKWNETKHPTCTEPGEKQRKCTACGVLERGVVSPTGHEFGPWSYTSHGMQTRKCKNCDKTETEQTPYEVEKRRKIRKKVFSFIAVILVIASIISAVLLSLPWLKQQEWFVGVTEGFSSMVSSLGKHDITFDANGGSGSMDSISVNNNRGVILPENKFTKPGYSFGGWSLSPDGEKKYSNKAYYSGGGIDVTLYAIWNPNRYSISFDDNGGSGYMSNVYGDAYETVTLSLNRFTKTYHTFKGWSTTPDGEVEYEDGAEYAIGIDNVTLYAVWEANSYEITFDANGGSGSMDSISVKYGESVSLPSCSFTRDEYTFAGWSLTSGGEVEYENSAEYTMGYKAVTLYAVWKYQDLTPYSDGLDFVLGINGKYMVVGIGKCTDSQLIIPPTHNGIVVDSIFKEAFSGCKSIKSVVIGDNVESVGDNAFSSCINIESIVIPKSVINISSSAFSGCKKLENIEVDATNANYKSIDGNLYSSGGKTLLLYAPGKKDSEFTIPSGVTAIGDNAFYNCNNLTGVVFSDSVESIGSYAFYTCYRLTDVVINYGVKSIGGSAFMFCYELTNVTIPNSVTEIGSSAFGYCGNLSKLIIPDSVEIVGSFAFSGCSGLEEVVISSNLKSLSSWMFNSCTSLKSVTIPEGVESIGTEAFYGCSALESITIPSSVTTIRSGAFYGCKSLKSVVLEGEGSWIMKKSGEASITLQPPFDPSSISVYITSIYSEYAWYRELNVV